MENSSEFFYEKLKNSNNTGPILAAHYCSLYDVEMTKSVIIMCNRLLKTFDRFLVFFSILDMYGSYPDGVETPYPLLFTICKRRFEASHKDSVIRSRESLDGYLRALEKDIESLSKKKLKIPSSEGL